MTNHLMRGHSSPTGPTVWMYLASRSSISFRSPGLKRVFIGNDFTRELKRAFYFLRPHPSPWPLPPLRPKRSAYGVAGLRSVRGQGQ